ncbi:MAG: PDZ domain-containing protein [Deltaproteobacteria bacterium]|nr:PDZ domain-containing protein [Deltaproteobacteria bacterium]
MKIKKEWFLSVVSVTVFLFFMSPLPYCFAQENNSFKPLFPVGLDHDFPEPRKTFDEIKGLILEQYYSDDITEKALYWAAVQGMLRHISPPEEPVLAKIWTAEEYEKILHSLQGVQVSLGIKSSFNPQDGSLTVTDVLPRSPAETILKPLDRILRIDSQPLKGISLNEVDRLLTGEEDTEVTLTVNRDIKTFDVTLKRSRFETQTLVISRLNNTIALVEIKKFTSDLSKKVSDELEKLKEEGFQGLIIDLRNNTGGVLAESLRTAELFLSENLILLRSLQRETDLQNYISMNDNPFEFDITVLVNRKTASSAEILTSALQDHQKAVIIGTRTFGKGVFEKTLKLKNDFRVKFITGAMYSPKGQSWQGKGITPDFLVEQDDKTLKALLKMEPKQRFHKDVAMITAYKLMTR